MVAAVGVAAFPTVTGAPETPVGGVGALLVTTGAFVWVGVGLSVGLVVIVVVGVVVVGVVIAGVVVADVVATVTGFNVCVGVVVGVVPVAAPIVLLAVVTAAGAPAVLDDVGCTVIVAEVAFFVTEGVP